MSERVRSGFLSTAVAVVAFGVAFGYVEAAVVVYLRSAIEAGSVIPAHDPEILGTLEATEIVRELATLVMIAAVGWLAGRSRLERLAWAAVVFGTWDIVYYVGLRLAIGWPPSLESWDVLFLVPTPWVAPVWAPLVVSSALVGAGLAAARRLRAGGSIVVGPTRAAGALAGGVIVITSFLLDAGADGSRPWTAWPVFWVGMALAIVATASALSGRPARRQFRPRLSSTDPSTDRRSARRSDSPEPQPKEVVDMADTVKDPVCGMMIRPEDAAATEVHEGRTFYFCSRACHDTFVNDPHRYGHPTEEHGGHGHH